MGSVGVLYRQPEAVRAVPRPGALLRLQRAPARRDAERSRRFTSGQAAAAGAGNRGSASTPGPERRRARFHGDQGRRPAGRGRRNLRCRPRTYRIDGTPEPESRPAHHWNRRAHRARRTRRVSLPTRQIRSPRLTDGSGVEGEGPPCGGPWLCRLKLGADVAEDVRDLRAEEEQRDDHDNGDQREEDAILGHRLTVLAAELDRTQSGENCVQGGTPLIFRRRWRRRCVWARRTSVAAVPASTPPPAGSRTTKALRTG